MLSGLSRAGTKRRSAIVESLRSTSSSRCRAVWAFAVDRCLGRHCWSRHGGQCPSPIRVAVLGENWVQTSTNVPSQAKSSSKRRLSAAATASSSATATLETSPGDDAAGDPDAVQSTRSTDPDTVLDGFVSAFGLPRQQLRMVLERQPALKLANPHILAQRMDAYSRATGLDAYQLFYMAARRPAFLRLSPPVLKERCEALAKSLALGFEDVLKLLVSQPAFLDVQPDLLRAVSGRVAGELGMRPGAALRVLARLPPSELRGVITRQQPGLIRERLAGLRRMMMRTFGPRRATPEAALLLVARCPPLLALPTKVVEAALAALMSIPPTKGAVMPVVAASGGAGAAASSGGRIRGRSSMFRAILSCPHVLTLPPETLRGRFVMLAAATRIDTPAVVSMLLLQPRLLLADPTRVRQRLEALTFSLMVPRSAALDMVVRQPQLLLYNTETLAENWAGLQRLLGITFDSALSIVTRHPNILCSSQVKLASKLASLEAIFAMPRPRAVLLAVEKPVVLTMSEESFQSSHRVLAPLLALPSPAHLGRLVCREPYLLLESTVKLTAKVSLTASLLGISESEVGAMLARSPHFITKELSYWQTNLDTVTGGLGVSLERAREVVVRYPYLLAAEPTELLSVASASMALVHSSPAWLSVLERADAESLFKCLAGFNDRNREHLQYLVDTGLQSEVSFLNPIIWNRTAFVKRFPRFADWQVAQRATTIARNGLPLPRRPLTWPPGAPTSAASLVGSSPSEIRRHTDEEAWDTDTQAEAGAGSCLILGDDVVPGRMPEAEDSAGSVRQPQPESPRRMAGWVEEGEEMAIAILDGRGRGGVMVAGGGGGLTGTRKPIPRRRKVRRIPTLSSSDEDPPLQPHQLPAQW
ncbi:hypothetical protein Vretifemale_7158 [Volvox reticuliferus]|nr:hypothetical protein Vretifemale_7158 [Volvox reticuliferus]